MVNEGDAIFDCRSVKEEEAASGNTIPLSPPMRQQSAHLTELSSNQVWKLKHWLKVEGLLNKVILKLNSNETYKQ
jgi:hypothetical protein